MDSLYFRMFSLLLFCIFTMRKKNPNIYSVSKSLKWNILNCKNKFRETQKSLFLSEKFQKAQGYGLARTIPIIHFAFMGPVSHSSQSQSCILSRAGCSRGPIEESNQTIKIAVIAVDRLLELGLAER